MHNKYCFEINIVNEHNLSKNILIINIIYPKKYLIKIRNIYFDFIN